MENKPTHIAMLALVVVCSWSCATTPGRSDRVAAGSSGPSRAPTGVRDAHEGLNGVLWVQTSAEFWALTSATYNSGHVLLERALGDKSWSAALEQASGYENLPPAVILDLDETVLDNSPAQAQIVLERTTYQQEMWTAWVDTMAAAAIPGAQPFIAFAETKGVKVFFVTNRAVSEQPATLKNLAALGIKASDESVLSPGENGWTSDKTARRSAIAKSYRVLLLVGDDMNDFVATTNLTPPQRVALAKQYRRPMGKELDSASERDVRQLGTGIVCRSHEGRGNSAAKA